MCVDVCLRTHLCTTHTQVCIGQKRTSDFQNLDLQVVVSCTLWVLRASPEDLNLQQKQQVLLSLWHPLLQQMSFPILIIKPGWIMKYTESTFISIFLETRDRGAAPSAHLLFLMSRTLEHAAYGACLRGMPQSADGAGSTEKLSLVKWHQIASENKTGLCQTRVSQVLWHARSWFGSAHHKLMDDQIWPWFNSLQHLQ